MFTQEVADKGIERIFKFLEDKGFKPGILYKTSAGKTKTLETQNGVIQKEITEVVFVPQHFRFEAGMHMDIILCQNRNEVMTYHFYFEDELPESAATYNFDTLDDKEIYSLNDFDKLIKDLGIGEIDKEMYLREKANLEAQLKELNDFLDANGIK
jgi:hypothetical protein